MKSDTVRSGASSATPAVHHPVTISKWVNEPLPQWDQILTAHDVARLARRPPWLLSGMALLGRFPRKHRFRGHKIGWLRSDICDWMASDLPAISTPPYAEPRRRLRAPIGPRQECLSLEVTLSCAKSRTCVNQGISGFGGPAKARL
jgi:hypothetical protein